MKSLKAYLVVLVLIGISPVTYASINTNTSLENESITRINQEDSMVLAANIGIQAGLENQMVTSGINNSASSDDVIPVSVTGIVFALFLLGAGSLVGRKKKAKTNDIVGVFARIN